MKKHVFKKAFAALLVLLTVMSTLIVLPVSAETVSYDISIDTPDALIAMGTSIAALADKTEVSIQLTSDIDMSGKPYAPVVTEKTIIFEGNSHTISNLTVGSTALPAENAGLFAQVGVNTKASNLTLENVSLHASKNAAGFAATALYGDYEFYNIHVSGTITAHHPDKLGVDTGIAAGVLGWVPSVGEQLGIATCVKASYCTNAANITADSAAGGIIGKLTGPASMQASYCANTGNLTATGVSDDARYFNGDVGGIIALSFHEWSTNAAWVYNYFENCYNTGDLSATTHKTASTPSIGGISGVIRCYGIGGMSPAPDYENELVYYNCFDYSKRTAIIPSTVPSTAPPAVLNYTHNAGIAGFCADYEIPQKLFTNCYTANKDGSTSPYSVIHSGRNIVMSNSGVVASAETEVPLTTGNASILNMISRIDLAISELGEISMPITVVNDGKPRDYTWYYNDNALVEKGTANAPYEITNEAQFAALSALVNGHHDAEAIGGEVRAINFDGKHFKLTANLNLAGYQILPLAMKDMTITFDGGGKRIANWKINQTSNGGMFSALGRGSTVKDLTLENVDVVGFGESGTLIGIAQAGITVSNINVRASCSVVTSGRVGGGIIGAIIDEEAVPGEDQDHPGDRVTVIYCQNNATVNAQEVVGGIVGYTKGVFDYQYTHCVNKGALTAERQEGASFYVGGIIGQTERGMQNAGYYMTVIRSCYNTGKLTTADTTVACYVGGIAGYLRAQTGSEIVIENCYDVSARKLSTADVTKLRNGAIGGHADDSTLLKNIYNSYAVNGEASESLFTKLATWDPSSTAMDDGYSAVVSALDAKIIIVDGSESTIAAEMAKIDDAIAKKTPITWGSTGACDHLYDNNCDIDCNKCGETRTVEHKYDNDQDTTCNDCGTTREVAAGNTNTNTDAADKNDTTTPEEKKGCKSTLNSTYTMIALVAVLGFAFLAKKREEN